MIIKKRIIKLKRFINRLNSLTFSKKLLYEVLDNLNLDNHPSLYITSSFSKIGNYHDGPINFLNDLLDYYGEKATISFPGHGDPAKLTIADLVLDLRIDKPHTGILPNLALQLESSLRSSHPFGSTISIGEKAYWINGAHEEDPKLCHEDSPLKRLTDIKTNIIGIGTDFTVNAFYHIIEDCTKNFPLNVYDKSNKLVKYIDFKGVKVNRKVYRYNQELAKYRIEKKRSLKVREDLKFYLQRNGVLSYFLLGDATCWVIKSELLFYYLQEWLNEGNTIYGELSNEYLIPFLKK